MHTSFSSPLWPDTKAVLRLPCSIHTLRWWRRIGRGPAFIRIGGRVYYRPEDIDAFLDACPRGGQAANRRQA
jgi:hypothetical protein